VDFAKASVSNCVVTNAALLWGSASDLRGNWFTVIGRVHNPVLSWGATLTPDWTFDEEKAVR